MYKSMFELIAPNEIALLPLRRVGLLFSFFSWFVCFWELYPAVAASSEDFRYGLPFRFELI